MTVNFQRKDQIFSKFEDRILSQTIYFFANRIFFAKRPFIFSQDRIYSAVDRVLTRIEIGRLDRGPIIGNTVKLIRMFSS